MSSEACEAENSTSDGTVAAGDLGAIANLFAQEKYGLISTIAHKDEEIHELKLKIHRLENNITVLKNESKIIQGNTKAQSKKTSTEVSSSTEEPSLLDSVHGYQTIVGESKPNMGKTEITTNKEDGVPNAKKKKVKKNIKGKRLRTNGLKSSSVLTHEINNTSTGSAVDGVLDCQKCCKIEESSAKFPQMPLSTFVLCRNRFDDADVNKDGTVDIEELTAIMESAGLYFTAVQVLDIMNKLDVNRNVVLDLMEVLQVINSLKENPNRRSDLPKSLKDSQSKVCVVM